MSAQTDGRKFEKEFAKLIGGQVVPGSGAFFTKLDVNGNSVLWSCKYTTKKSAPVNNDLFKEIDHAINGPGGIGGDIRPGVVTKAADGTIICSMRLDDMMMMLQEERSIAPPKPFEVDLSRRVPALLRDLGEN